MGNWAFSWVQIVAHNKIKLMVLWLVLSLISFVGLNREEIMLSTESIMLLICAFLLMAFVTGYFLESRKIAMLQLGLSGYSTLMTLGLVSWLGVPVENESLLGLVVLMTVVSGNLIHVFSTLSREMARGLFQYDAIAEAIKLNHTPILLSNLTTALGFGVAAFFESSLMHLATLVGLGCLFAYFLILIAVPIILLSWLLEFRVGNSKDRHGMAFVLKRLEANRWIRPLILFVTFLLCFALFTLNHIQSEFFEGLLAIGCTFLLLFWWAYKHFTLALFNVVTCVLALLISLLIFTLLFENHHWLSIIWMIPLGIIVDDTIHFFSRFVRAKQQYFNEPKSAMKFAIASVGRAVWITSWVVCIGLAVLLFSSVEIVWQSAALTIVGVVLITYIVIILFPALFIVNK